MSVKQDLKWNSLKYIGKLMDRQLPLPQSNSNEDLETISRRHFALLFDPKLFEIRHEDFRDKGIDLTIEVKENGAYTNFRSSFQLKATRSAKPNRDDSISLSISVSNIQYLLNFVMPSYYVLYDATLNLFYIENANTVYAALVDKYRDDPFPDQFTIRFTKQLDTNAVSEIYNDTLSKGKLLSRISPNITNNSAGIVVDFNKHVFSIDDNLRLINKFGFNLLNDHRFDTIIELEKRCHPRQNTTPVFNLVCGIAYYQKAQIFKAIEFMKNAEKEKGYFEPPVRSMLEYTLLNARFILGLISEDALKEGVSKIINSQEIGSFLQLEKIKKDYWEGPVTHKENQRSKLLKLYADTQAVLADDKYSTGAFVMAYAFILNSEYIILINEALKNFLHIAGRVKYYQQTKTYKQFEFLEKALLQRFDATIEYAYKIEDLLGMVNVSGDKVAWAYNKASFRYILDNFDIQSFTVDGPVNAEDTAQLKLHLQSLDKQIMAYEHIDHVENAIACLERKYEIQHFIGLADDASSTAREIDELITTHEFNGIRERLNQLMTGQTSHERMADMFIDHTQRIYDIAKKSRIGEYFKEPLDDELLATIEENVKWAIGPFMEFKFPPIQKRDS